MSDSLQPQGLQHARLLCPSHQGCQASLSWSLLKLMFIESVMPSNHLILCRPLLLPPSIFPRIRVFSNESELCIRAKVLEFQLQHQSFQLIFRTDFFRMDWVYLLAVKGTHKSLLQNHSSIASVFRYSAIFIDRLSHPYMNDYWKNNSLD